MDWRRTSWPILITLGLILAIGLIFLQSASYGTADKYSGFAESQVKKIVFCLACFVTVLLVPYDRIGRRAGLIYVAGLVLLVGVFFVGRSANGSNRWIPLKVIDLQPSEVMKISLIIVLAQVLRIPERLRSWRGLVPPFVLTFIPMALILKQPDLGSAVILLPILFAMLYVGRARILHLSMIAGAGLAACPIVFFCGLKAYQQARITAFIDPEADSLGAGYQILQSLTAIGSGGLTGKGWGLGTQTHLEFLPERHTDFIFAVIAEEWGFVGAAGLLTLYLVLIALAIGIAARTRDPAGRLIVTGAITLLASQIIINAGMTVGLMPITGLTLPFVSFGGSSLLVSFVAVGLIVNVGMRPLPVLTPDAFPREFALRPTSSTL